MTTRTPLDDIEYLARSPHRVRVLDVLADEDRTRSAIREVTGISQPTLSRILNGFEERGWLVARGRTYSLTPFGRLLAAEFGALHEAVEAMQRLQEVAPYLPLDEMDFDVRAFRNATVTTPRPPDVNAHVRRVEELVQGATRVCWAVGNYYLDSIPKQRELVVDRGQTQEVIISKDALDGLLSHPEAATGVRELLGTERMTVYRYDGEVPVGLGTMDDTAAILPYDERKVPRALIETRDETVREWVAGQLGEYRERSDPITVEDLPE